METYCRVVETDVPFWHRERTNLGLLASAAWRIDWVALEEFVHPKQFSTSREHGRSDLWIKGPRTEEFVEAKWHGVRIPSDRDRIGELMRIYGASSRAEALRVKRGVTTTGVVALDLWSAVGWVSGDTTDPAFRGFGHMRGRLMIAT
jgi:hypothetical protein